MNLTIPFSDARLADTPPNTPLIFPCIRFSISDRRRHIASVAELKSGRLNGFHGRATGEWFLVAFMTVLIELSWH